MGIDWLSKAWLVIYAYGYAVFAHLHAAVHRCATHRMFMDTIGDAEWRAAISRRIVCACLDTWLSIRRKMSTAGFVCLKLHHRYVRSSWLVSATADGSDITMIMRAYLARDQSLTCPSLIRWLRATSINSTVVVLIHTSYPILYRSEIDLVNECEVITKLDVDKIVAYSIPAVQLCPLIDAGMGTWHRHWVTAAPVQRRMPTVNEGTAE